ncbi:saccharopine dehydrogenase (NADP+, L-glutamate-forming) [Balamuthia mandrillaris]
MRELEAEAKEKGLVIINECGVDPGTDHMSAMRVIHRVRENGGRVTSFLSYCGGLPAPDSNDNPFGYKYSWSPRGVLLASRNAAHFLRDGKIVDIAGQDLFDNFEVEKIEALDAEVESYPNRNSCQYIDTYGLSAVKTMIRGTYRYKGWCVSIKKLVDLGFLDLEERAGLPGKTYPAMIAEMVKEQKEKKGSASSSTAASLKEEVAQLLNVEPDHYAVNNMEWLGLFDENNTIPAGIKTRLDALCHLMQSKMQYKPGERDMILMKHEFIATYPDDKQEKITCMLIDYGISNGDTSMSRTVSLPVAIATRLVLEGKYTKPGLSIPIVPELYNPILDELETLGIKFVDTAKPL